MCRLVTAIRRLAVVPLCALLLTAFEGQALARSIFVRAGAPPGGDGNAETPYRRITDAVVEARTIRRTAHERIVIHVAPGTYVGSYDAAALRNNPDLEILPIILNVSKLALRGETTLTEDDRGLPTGTETDTETVITSDRPLALGQSLLLIAPTTDGMEPHDVTVSELVLDAQIPATSNLAGRGIVADRAMDFVIRHNLIRHTSTGIQTRLASGIIQGNLLVNNNGNGVGAGGGSQAQPAEVAIRGNRATENLVGLILGAVANTLQLQLGENEVTVPPLQTTFNRDDPHDEKNIPDTLEATVTKNDFSGNRSAGLRCFFLSPNIYNTSDATQRITGTIVTTVRNNLLRANGDYGIVVDAGFLFRSTPRQFITVFDGTFSENDLDGNTRAPAFFGFTRVFVSLGIEPRSQFKYLQDSRFDIVDSDGEFTAFDFDNPASDPFDGTTLRNRLTINENAISRTLIH
jgi:hypothetical protein